MTTQLRWGIVGLGGLAHNQIAPAIAASEGGRLVACAGRTFERAEQFAAAHGAARAYRSYEELVQDPEVDAVFISTPNNLHYPAVLAAAAARKHVLCEKPMAPTVGQAEEMLAGCRAAGVTLCIGLQMRFNRILQDAATLVREGRLGAVRELSVQRYAPLDQAGLWRKDLSAAGAGVVADVGVHLIDYAHWIVGDEIARVFASCYPARSSGRPDDSATVILEFSGGCVASLHCSREMPFGANDLEIFGTSGMLATGPLRYVDAFQLTVRTAAGTEERRYPADNLYLHEIDAFAREVAGQRTALAAGEDGVWLTKITDAVIRSLETGASVAV